MQAPVDLSENVDESTIIDDAAPPISSDDMKDKPFPRRQPVPEAIARQYAWNPRLPDHLLLTGAKQRRPPLITDPESDKTVAYDMGQESGGSVLAQLNLRSATDDGASWNVTIPLRMVPYKTPADASKLFDEAMCRRVDAENKRSEDHNRYLSGLLSLFIRENGCSTSATHVTCPPPPVSFDDTRVLRIKELMSDKYSSTLLAVTYMAERSLLAQRDYDISEAVKAANKVAFTEEVRRRVAAAPIRFRLKGSPPATWSGRPEDRDSMGRKLFWSPSEHHTFVSPSVEIIRQEESLV